MDQCEWVNFIIQNHFKWITGVLGILVIETDSTNRISGFLLYPQGHSLHYENQIKIY